MYKTAYSNDIVKKSQFLKVPFSTKVAYGCGDVACNISFGVVGTYLTLFYTDYIGISAATVGLVMLLSRVFDGVSDIIMGYIVSHTKSKYGQSRPWILWTAVPYTISIILLFMVPQTSPRLQFIYIFVTYNFSTTIMYTAVNLPYGSLSAMLTRDQEERDMVSVFRMAMSPFGRIAIAVFTMPVVKMLGNDQRAWIISISIWATVALFLLLFCFAKCKENVCLEERQVQEKEKRSGKATIKALFTNQYFWIVGILWMLQNATVSVTGIMLPYYCKYIFQNETWMYSVLYFSEFITVIIGVMLCPMLIKRIGKRNTVLIGAFIALAAQCIFMVNPYSFKLTLVISILRGLGAAPLNACVFGMLNDVVEFGHWKSGLRQEAYIFSAGSVGSKIGPGLTTAIVTGLMTISGYISSTSGAAVQPQSALDAIVSLYMFGPLIVWIIVAVVTFMYKLDKIYPKIISELAEREGQGEY
ncbi:MAG: glycoside-pentoside-hexuronide (GPH):cation symporter [Terrisporobacter sp.]|uniref:MFS transporter n=1 Tax=Terrisporobacter sp. TaxID=1965305 RepID=UPI002FC7AFD2